MSVRTSTILIVSFALTLGLAACGSGRSGGTTDGGHSGFDGGHSDLGMMLDLGMGPHDSGMTGTDLGMTGHDSGPTGVDGGMCIAHCTASSQCASTCPAMTGRVECCDLPTGHCFATSGAVCPAATDAGSPGTDASMY